MFQLVTDPNEEKYKHPISVNFPGNNGKTVTQKFFVWFKRLTQDQLDNIHERLQSEALSDAGLLDEVMVGWEDVSDSNSQPVEFSSSSLAALLNMHPTRPTLVREFFASIKLAPRKN